jgi:hypothetical protein
MKTLEERILEIIEENIVSYNGDIVRSGIIDCPSEITALIEKDYVEKAFVEWLSFGDHLFYPTNGKEWLFYKTISEALANNDEDKFPKDNGEIMSTEKVFQYWKDNIKKG